MDSSPRQQRELSIPYRSKENTPSLMADNAMLDFNHVHDMTFPAFHTGDPATFKVMNPMKDKAFPESYAGDPEASEAMNPMENTTFPEFFADDAAAFEAVTSMNEMAFPEFHAGHPAAFEGVNPENMTSPEFVAGHQAAFEAMDSMENMTSPEHHEEHPAAVEQANPERDPNCPECLAGSIPIHVPDMTCPKCRAEEPEAFDAALILMNLNAEDKMLGETENDQKGQSSYTIEDGDLVITKRIPLFRPIEKDVIEVESSSDGESSVTVEESNVGYHGPYVESGSEAEQSATPQEHDVENGSDAEQSATNQEPDAGDSSDGEMFTPSQELAIINAFGAMHDKKEDGNLLKRKNNRGTKLALSGEGSRSASQHEVEGRNLTERIELPVTNQAPDFGISDEKEGGSLYDRVKRRRRSGKDQRS